jgi:phage-related protein
MKKRNRYREIFMYKDYFQRFFEKQTVEVQNKIGWTLELIQCVERVPETYLKHIESTAGLYEIRVQSGSNIFRIFCFFDGSNLVVVFNGFQKKTNKTPKNEIKQALKIKHEYENEE